MLGVDLGDIIQGGSGLVALYLAIQIKAVLANHEARITKLEADANTTGNRGKFRHPGRNR